MKSLQKRPFIFLFIALLVLLVFFVFVRNKKLSDELRLVKEEKESYVKESETLALQLKEQSYFIENKDELYAKMAAELHKVRKELEEERNRKKRR